MPDVIRDLAKSISELAKRVRKLEAHSVRQIKYVINVRDYGATGNGTTDDTAAIQAAWAALPAGGYGVFEFTPDSTFLISDTLDFSGKNFITIRGNRATIQTKAGVDFSTKPMVDFAGCAYSSIYDLRIESTLAVNSPIVGLLLGRTTTMSGGQQLFQHVVVSGYFSFSAYYNVGSEVNTYISCYFANFTNNAHAAFISNDDTQSLLDVSAGHLTGYYYGCVFHCFGTGTCYNIYLRGYVADHGFYGCYGVPSLGGKFVYTEAGAGVDVIHNCVFDNIRVEPATGDNSNTRFLYHNTGSMQNCTFRNIGWNMNNGTGNDPDYVYEFVGDGAATGAMTNCFFFLAPNTYSSKLININDTAYLVNCKFWCDTSTGAVKQVTVESGADLYRCSFYWPTGIYPFDATPAGMNLVEHVPGYVGTSANVITFADEDATPTVGGGVAFQTSNTAATTITDFDDGYDGQEIFVIFFDTFTTLDFSGTALHGNDGADYTTHLYDVLRAVKHGGYWYCQIIQSQF